MKSKFLLAGILFCMVVTSASAQRRCVRHDAQRIHQGIRNGSINQSEARALALQARSLRREEKLAKADGVITPAEKAALKQDQKALSHSIYVDKHN